MGAHAEGGTLSEVDRLSTDRKPLISVVMSARNEAPYIDAAVASVLAQTFTDFEFVIHDDASSDGTSELLRAWAARDPRIRLQRSDESLGVWSACNRAIGTARAAIIARMDGDDIAHPDWLARLYDVLSERPDVVLVGCLWTGMDATGRKVRAADRWRVTQPSIFPPFGHGSSMFRRAAFDRVGGYRRECIYWEDFDLTLRLAREGRVLVVPEELYRYRFAATSTRLVADQSAVERGVATMFRCADAYRRTGDYEVVLRSSIDGAPGSHGELQRTLLSLSSNRLWNALRPRKWRRVAATTRRPITRATITNLAIATWSEISPRSLRTVLAALIAWRSRRAPAQAGTPPVRWEPRLALSAAARRDAAVGASFALVAASCAPDTPERRRRLARIAAGPIDAPALLQLAHWHRVEPFVQAAVVAADVTLPHAAARRLANLDRKGRMKALTNVAEEARLAQAAGTAGVDLLFLKGATLAHLVHADPTAKKAWDIDVLIAPEDMTRARLFLEAHGYVLELPQGVAVGPRLDRWLASNRESLWRNAERRTAVELHTGLCESPAMIPDVGMRSPRQAVMLAGVPVPTLATVDLFAFLTVHGTSHGWARLKWLADVAALVRASDMHVTELHDAAVDRGAGWCPGVALLLCSRLFGTELPPVLQQRLESDRGVVRLVDYSWAAIEQEGDTDRRLGATTVREMARAIRLQFWLAPGLRYRLRTFWSHWTRPYAASQLGMPPVLMPVAMLGWLPLRLLSRRWRRA